MNTLGHDNERPKLEKPKVRFGEFLKLRRTELDRTQKEMGLPSGHITQIEKGQISKVSPTNLIKLAKCYEFKLSDLSELGVDIDEELVNSARAIVIGEAIMTLPDADLENVVYALGIDEIY